MRDEIVRIVLMMMLIVSMIHLKQSEANIADYDDHWKERAERARTKAAKAYNPDPHGLTKKFKNQARKSPYIERPSYFYRG
ncbi:unnamed protein product [Amaranthus hypochondriacus]